MKIGILTFIHTKNFGANLQCFALQQKIHSMNYNVEVINLYRPGDKGYIACEKDKERFAPIYSCNSWRDYRSKFNKKIVHLISWLKSLFNYSKSKINKQDGFQQFHHDYIHFSSKCYRNYTQLYEEFPHLEYTHLVVGSDQVWNYASDFSREPFFLTFTDESTKISYAASVGHASIPETIKPIFKKWLDGFFAISVREKTSVTEIKDITGKDVYNVIDPTLLLNKEQWLNALSIKDIETSPFVLVYMLSVSESTLQLAHDVASKLNCGIKLITNRPLINISHRCEVLRDEDPKSFVELYSKAKFIVTNSFHGTAFAINFNVPFVTMDKRNARLNVRKGDLLKLLNLEHRNLFEGDAYNVDQLLKCDFSEANSLLEKERIFAEKYLKSVFA